MAILAELCLGGTTSPSFAGDYRPSDVEEQMIRLNSDNHEEQISGASKLCEMGAIAKPAVTRLIHLLETAPENTTRGECAKALGNIGPGAVAAVPALIAFLQNKSCGYERAYAPNALGDIGLEYEKSVPALIEALKNDEEPVVRGLSAQALGSFGANASVSIPDLVQSLKTGDHEMRSYAAYALGKIPARPCDVQTLIALLSDDIDATRIAAAKSLGGAKADAVPAIPHLVLLLTDQNVNVAAAAASSLGEMGPSAGSAVNALKLAQKNAQIRYETTYALKKIRGR
jgi:HEAT repeat protein